jgi:CheY-like chemotaxis protein
MGWIQTDNVLMRPSSDQRGSAGVPPPSAATSSDPAPSRRHPPAVLLVEDDRQLAQMYCTRLELAGIDVTVARDGDEALTLASTLAHDLVLMDLGLPKRGGLDVIRLLRAAPATAELPLAVLSNYSEPGMISEAQSLGILAYLVKADTTPSRLVDAVSRWLGERGAH